MEEFKKKTEERKVRKTEETEQGIVTGLTGSKVQVQKKKKRSTKKTKKKKKKEPCARTQDGSCQDMAQVDVNHQD